MHELPDLDLPLGDENQELVLIRRDQEGRLTRQSMLPVRFVPMTGEVERR